MTRRAAKKGRRNRARVTDPLSARSASQYADGTPPTPGGLEMTTHAIGSPEEHLAARLELLEAEKDLTRRGDIALD
jgi:hypothetical protein